MLAVDWLKFVHLAETVILFFYKCILGLRRCFGFSVCLLNGQGFWHTSIILSLLLSPVANGLSEPGSAVGELLL